MGYSKTRMAGALLFIGIVQFMFGMLLAELLYPNYSVSLNYISDLGATCRDTCVIVQPSSVIFNTSVSLLGLLLLATAYYLWKASTSTVLTILVTLTGVGALGVGFFPETAGFIHHIFSLITFLFAGLSALAAYKLEKRPLSYMSVLMGLVTLAALALYVSHVYLGLGNGGMERMIVYPVLLWAVGFGGHLMASDSSS